MAVKRQKVGMGLVWVSAALLIPTFVAADETLLNRFREEAPREWRVAEQRIAASRAQVSDRGEWFGDEPQPPVSQTAFFNGADGCFKYEKLRVGADSYDEFVCGINADYAFILRRERAGSPFRVVHLGTESEDVIATVSQHSILFNSIMVHWVWLEPLFDNQNTRLISVEPVVQDEDDLCRVEFAANFEGNGYIVESGVILFDPGRHWTVREFRNRLRYLEGVGISTGVLEYPADKSIPIPLKYVHEEFIEHGDAPVYRRTIDFSDIGAGDVPCKECTLTAYGLTEPGLRANHQRRTSLLLWLNLAAVICLGIGVLINWRRKQRTEATKTKPK